MRRSSALVLGCIFALCGCVAVETPTSSPDSTPTASPLLATPTAVDPTPSSAPTASATPSPTDAPTPSPTASPTPSATPSEAPTPSPTATAPADFGLVESATVLIEATGSFVDPDTGAAIIPGSGSGFLVSEDGFVVTNNHVVAGASIIKVHVPGRADPLPGRLVGYSECSDLAVVDVDGSDHPFLVWSLDPQAAGTPVFAAGYPDGDPRFTISDGIVAREASPAATPWSSLTSEIEHTAPIRSGNSGGPLVGADGAIVGVNYAGIGDLRSFAIGSEEASPLIDRLQAGESVRSIGVNAQAIEAGQTAPAGMWVYSVVPGSPADATGIKAGDILTELGGLPVGEDGTAGSYCDVLGSHASTDVLDVALYRSETAETLNGQLNGRVLGSTQDGFTPDQLRLLEHVPQLILENDGCASTAEEDIAPGSTASVVCYPPDGAEVLWYESFPDVGTMREYFDFYVDDNDLEKNSGSCRGGPSESSWSYTATPNKAAGRTACWVSDRVAWMVWTDNTLLIASTAYRDDRDWVAFYRWWRTVPGPV